MSTYLSIHTREKPQKFGTGDLKFVMEDNANALQLCFGDTTITVYDLSDTDAHLLLEVAKMSADERDTVLSFIRGKKKAAQSPDTFVFDGMQS